LFGKIVENEMRLNEYGKIVAEEWDNTGVKRHSVQLEEFVVMPNHVHGIIRILNAVFSSVSCRDVARNVSTMDDTTNKYSVISPESGSLPAIIRSFKSAVTNRMHTVGFIGMVWQPRFYDHIIRDEKSLFHIRAYIRNNPLNWNSDEENPCAKSPR
jgi:REP element-mobilizing transposase RayT